jgi:adenylylsulfate kinase
LQKGVTVWFTGLSGSGKTTISKIVEQELKNRQIRHEILDGDVVRQHLTADLGFSKEDRQKNIERVSFVAKLLTRNDVFVLASFISPYPQMREHARREIDSFIEVYVKCSLEECTRRDVKGLYKKALNGEISKFTGVSDPFEEPKNPELIINTELEAAELSARKVINYLKQNDYIW